MCMCEREREREKYAEAITRLIDVRTRRTAAVQQLWPTLTYRYSLFEICTHSTRRGSGGEQSSFSGIIGLHPEFQIINVHVQE